MSVGEIVTVLQWWTLFFIIGVVFFPITNYFFRNFFDRGYIFSKILGISILTYIIFILGIFHLAPFTATNSIIVLTLITIIIATYFLYKNNFRTIVNKTIVFLKQHVFIFIFEEVMFLVTLCFWAWVRGFAPDIHGLEKYMDFGFINSILRSNYFPPKDMWFTPLSINYYYFGHIVTAVLTKISFVIPAVAYNLMLATIFAFTFTASFSIAANLLYFKSQNTKQKTASQKSRINKILLDIRNLKFEIFGGGFLTAILISFGGNLHTIYTLFKPYQNENPIPFWQLPFSPLTFPNAYWYPNATRFIHNTIHEFPLYSFVVSDLHGHVLDIPFVLLIIALLFSLMSNVKFKIFNQFPIYKFSLLLGFLLAAMYMTNAWDGLIYFLLMCLIIFVSGKIHSFRLTKIILNILLVGFFFFVFLLPFNHFFKPFVSGIGIVCAPEFLTNIGKLGPFLFEKDHCLRSPIWQLFILYGFFYFWVTAFIVFIFFKPKKILISDIFVFLLILLSTFLIIIPEFIYAKDIYPAHYRANTMFKLVYQSFVMLSISTGYIVIRIISNIKLKTFPLYFIFSLFALLFFIFVLAYPYFAINSYYGNLQTYKGLNGFSYLKDLYPTDYDAIVWIQKNIKGQPVILEAHGDSYTDYARVSANTGLPTLLGWTVHEWLWRGTYDIPAPRIEEIKTLYESSDSVQTKQLLDKYNVALIFVGTLERQKYPTLREEKFKKLGIPIYHHGETSVYKITR